MKSKQNQKPLWLLAALAAPAAHFSGCGWLVAGLTAVAVLPLSLVPKDWSGLPRPIALAEIFWLGLVAGYLLPVGTVYWPSDNDLAVPLTILALAAWTGVTAGPRIGAVLAFCMALLAVPLAASGAAHLKTAWLRPEFGNWSAGLAAAMLLPALPAAGENGKGKLLSGAGALTVLLAALVQGVISPEAAGTLEDAFYQTSRTLGYLEPIAAVGVTLGWYALTVLLLQSAKQIAQNSGLRPMIASILAAGAATGSLLLNVRLNGWLVLVLNVLFWILIPFSAKINFLKKR